MPVNATAVILVPIAQHGSWASEGLLVGRLVQLIGVNNIKFFLHCFIFLHYSVLANFLVQLELVSLFCEEQAFLLNTPLEWLVGSRQIVVTTKGIGDR